MDPGQIWEDHWLLSYLGIFFVLNPHSNIWFLVYHDICWIFSNPSLFRKVFTPSLVQLMRFVVLFLFVCCWIVFIFRIPRQIRFCFLSPHTLLSICIHSYIEDIPEAPHRVLETLKCFFVIFILSFILIVWMKQDVIHWNIYILCNWKTEIYLSTTFIILYLFVEKQPSGTVKESLALNVYLQYINVDLWMVKWLY